MNSVRITLGSCHCDVKRAGTTAKVFMSIPAIDPPSTSMRKTKTLVTTMIVVTNGKRRDGTSSRIGNIFHPYLDRLQLSDGPSIHEPALSVARLD